MSQSRILRNADLESVDVEELLEDSDDDIEVVPKKNTNKFTSKKIPRFSNSTDSKKQEIVLDDSDSDIEEVINVAPLVIQKKSNAVLDENKVKSILNKVASKQTSGSNQPAKFSTGLKITISHNKEKKSNHAEIKTTKSNITVEKTEQSTPKSAPATNKIVLQKTGSGWQSTPKNVQTKAKVENVNTYQQREPDDSDKEQSNSDDDFVPVKRHSMSAKSKNKKDSDTDEDNSFETFPTNVNRSRRSTRRSTVTLSDFSQDDVTMDDSIELDTEIQEELAKLEALQEILAKHNSDDKKTRSNMSNTKGRKSQTFKKQSVSKISKAKKMDIPKPKPAVVPQIIERGLTDCFDELIIETTAGFPCSFCETKEMFKKRREMIYHMQTRHDDELNEEQKNGDLSGLFPCEVCNTAFCSKYILRTHRKAHMKSQVAGCDKYYQYYLRFGQA